MRWWTILLVIFYPLAFFFAPWGIVSRIDQLSALGSGCIVFTVLWLGILPADLSLPLLEPRFAAPLVAYMCGLVVVAVLMSWTTRKRRT